MRAEDRRDRGQRTEDNPQITQITRIRKKGTEDRGRPGEIRFAVTGVNFTGKEG